MSVVYVYPSMKETVDQLFKQNPKMFIMGSWVYKHLLRGEDVKDIDCLVSDSKSAASVLLESQKKHATFSLHVVGSGYGSHWAKNLSSINMSNGRYKIDFFDISAAIESINEHGLFFTNLLVLTRYGIRHILEVSDIANNIVFESKDPKIEREWAINMIKNKSYCKSGTREKDMLYFKNWSVIDPVECAKHGVFDTRSRNPVYQSQSQPHQ